MTILLKNKHTLQFDSFKFKCCIGKNGFTKFKKEGDSKTPKGVFEIENLYFREDRIPKPNTKLKCIKIKKNMFWCDDPKSKKYNKLTRNPDNFSYEKLLREDYKYDLLIPVKYNFNKVIPGKGSCIFIHITKDYKPTKGCIALVKKDLLILLKLINKKTKIKIF